MSSQKVEPDCMSRCRSSQHGDSVVSSLTVRGTTEAKLAAYLRATCCNYCQVKDRVGRTALHMAASCGHCRLAHWLVQHKDCNINGKDVESGYTALHRSVMHGQIHVAVSLIGLGANISLLDNDHLTAIEHAMVDRLPVIEYSLHNLCEVYVWGTNANYTLGTGNQQSRQTPELLESFRKQNISIKQVAMHKFHSVFVSHDGQAYSCGHGQGGRLGLGSEQAALAPCPIKLGVTTSLAPERCLSASVSNDHTVLLTEAGNVYTFGLNSYHQLGISPPPSHLLSPTLLPARCVKSLGTVLGVCASRFHTVVWGSKGVLTCGLHAGQLGHDPGKEKTIVKPKIVSALNWSDCSITLVASSNGAIVVMTDKGQMFLLHEFQCRRIASRQLNVTKLVVAGGHLAPLLDRDILMERGGDSLKVLALTSTGWLMLWEEASGQFSRCFLGSNRLLLLRDVAMYRQQVFMVSRDGEGFVGEIKPRKKKKVSPQQSPKPSSKVQEKCDFEVTGVTKLAHIHRAVSITCDEKGRNFALIQTHPKQALFDVPVLETTTMRENMNNLLLEANECDAIHDVVFQVGLRTFPAHQYVVASQSEYLAKLMADKAASLGKDRVLQIPLDNVHAEVFEQVLQYIYTNQCDMTTLGKCPNIPREEEKKQKARINSAVSAQEKPMDTKGLSAFEVHSKEKKKAKKSKSQEIIASSNTAWDPVRIVQRIASRFKMQNFLKELEGFSYDDGYIISKNQRRKSASPPKWNRRQHEHLYDTVIHCDDGKEMQAHKCILVSRLEYFHSMLCQGWSETSTNVLKLSLPFDIVEVLIDFLYEDDVSTSIRDSEDLDLLSNLLVVADQLLVDRLKEQCEMSLINVLTLKNAGDLLQLAELYNAKQLKNCCMQYICLNIASFLESRSLECLNVETLAELSRYYIELNPAVKSRSITPYSFGPSSEVIDSVFGSNPFAFEDSDSVIFENSSLKREIRLMKKKQREKKAGNEGTKTLGRTRNESISSIASDDLDHGSVSINFKDISEKSLQPDTSSAKENKDGNTQWVKIPTLLSKKQKIVQARLKAINASMDADFVASATQESFTKLTRSVRSSFETDLPSEGIEVPNSPIQATSPVQARSERSLPVEIAQKNVIPSDFPELCSPPNSHNNSLTHHKSDKVQPKPVLECKKITKISQKQRKRLSSINDIGLMADHLDALNLNQTPPSPAWGHQSPKSEPSSNFSLVDIIKQERKQVRLSPALSPPVVQKKAAEVQPVVAEKGAASSAWQKIPAVEAKLQITKQKAALNFTDIIADEKKQKDNLSRMLAKSLELTQIEDKAISDLLLFYNAAGVTDEKITVQRVSTGPMAVPTWITNH